MTLRESISITGMSVYRFGKTWGLSVTDLYQVCAGRKAASRSMLKKFEEAGFDVPALFDARGMIRSGM